MSIERFIIPVSQFLLIYKCFHYKTNFFKKEAIESASRVPGTKLQ